MLGWAGATVVTGALLLTWLRLSDFRATTESIGEDLSPLVWCALFLAMGLLFFTGARSISGSEGRLPRMGDVLVRGAAVLAGVALVWASFPTRHLLRTASNARQDIFPEQVVGLWVGVCGLAVGLVLVLFSRGSLCPQRWVRASTGGVAGLIILLPTCSLTPMVVHALTVEHTVADGVQEAGPVPTIVTRVGWSWRPEQRVVGVERGPSGPIVLHPDGFVALDGATGEELWSYRLPYARQVETGLFPGSTEYAYLRHVAEPGTEEETEVPTMVVLDTATGEIVREAPMPPLDAEEEPRAGHLTPEVRVSGMVEEGRPWAVAHSTTSTERIWEFPLDEGREGRLCLWVPRDGIAGYADRVLIHNLCLDEPETSSTQELRELLDRMAVPDDAVERVIVLDVATGEPVWSREWSPKHLFAGERPVGSGALMEDEDATVVLTSGGAFTLAEGEPVEFEPDAPSDVEDRPLGVDSTGAVMAREIIGEESAMILRTDAGGAIVDRTEVERDFDIWRETEHAGILRSALLVPYLSDAGDGRVTRELAIAATEDERSVWERLDFDDEPMSDPVDRWNDEGGHRLVVVPGSVVSYIENGGLPGGDREPLYGLVP
ncbi:hypothetical protein [Nocardiopsis sp. LDBS1602]|uniref:hypothetical protein n=1 Tax=Nocardiopsis sp. LDBS1602 TaxID=3109597 RepID=UPI002DB5BBFD|nr:hypothetical protein [Nocardiopsis sp. LDBS1602]MEC3891372.1 hypothetical protein [Nocardiopsis sp. LDBS1602]